MEQRTIDQLIHRAYKYPRLALSVTQVPIYSPMSSVRPYLVPAWLWLVIMILLTTVMAGCIKRDFTQSRNLDRAASAPRQQPPNSRININTASAAELEELPGIGPALAARIVEHRERYGPFRRAEHLIVVRGFSDRRFRALQEMITVE